MSRAITIALLFVSVNLHAMEQQNTSSDYFLSTELCSFIEQSIPLTYGNFDTPSNTFRHLHFFFYKNNIKDYADAAQYGRENTFFKDPDSFNEKMGPLFKLNKTDIYPSQKRKNQVVAFGTSGIDVFMERLAFLARLKKNNALDTNELIALIGTHAHRKDLMNTEYLLKLPALFKDDFDLTQFDQEKAKEMIEKKLEKQQWQHRDGMELAWDLISCDPKMNELKSTFSFYAGNGEESLRTEELIKHLVAYRLQKPLTKENPIAFIANSQGAAKTKEIINNLFPNQKDAIDLFIAKPAPEEIEATLFNDTNPQQRAMTKLFHYYRILETELKPQVDVWLGRTETK